MNKESWPTDWEVGLQSNLGTKESPNYVGASMSLDDTCNFIEDPIKASGKKCTAITGLGGKNKCCYVEKQYSGEGKFVEKRCVQ